MKRFLAFTLCVGLTACGNAGEVVQTERVSATIAPSPTSISVKSSTPQPAATVVTATWTPKPSPTEVPTSTPTPPVWADHEPYLVELATRGFEQIFSAALTFTDGSVVKAYGFADTHLSPARGGESGPEICRLAFHRLNGASGQWLATIDAPTYPQGSRYAGYPVSCSLAEWDEDFWSTDIWGANFPLDVIRRTLGLHGPWSDINQNGSEELGILQWYCANGCHGYEGAVHFYELRDDGTVVDITADLPGIVLPWKMLQSVENVALYVFDPSLEYEPHVYIDTWWIYAWNGSQYVNVSSEHSNEYHVRVDETARRLTASFGQPFGTDPKSEVDILSVLFTLEKAGESKKALEELLNVSDPAHWPGTDKASLCWLQYVRASAQDDYASGREFSLPRGSGGLAFSLPDSANHLRDGYDLSACDP